MGINKTYLETSVHQMTVNGLGCHHHSQHCKQTIPLTVILTMYVSVSSKYHICYVHQRPKCTHSGTLYNIINQMIKIRLVTDHNKKKHEFSIQQSQIV